MAIPPSILQFNNILNKVKGRFTKAFPKIGRRSKINQHKDRLLLILLYYRTYITHEFLGYFVGLDKTSICRLFARIEPLIAKYIHIKKCKRLTEKEVHRLLIDATEQPIQRPKKKAKRSYIIRERKKDIPIKLKLVMTDKGRIVQISKTKAGSIHDLTYINLKKHCQLICKNIVI